MTGYEAAKKWVLSKVQRGLGSFPAVGRLFGVDSYSTPWPPREDKPRLERYRRYRRIYEGEHERVYVKEGKYEYDEEREYVTINLSGEITDLLVDRLFGENVHITAETQRTQRKATADQGDGNGGGERRDAGSGQTAGGEGEGEEGVSEGGASAPPPDPGQDWIDHVSAICGLEQGWVKLGTGTSYRGDGVLKVRYDAPTQDGAPGEVRISYVRPELTFIKTAEDDAEKILQITIAYIMWGADKPYLFQEIHTPGWISYRLYELHGDLSKDYGFTPEKDQRDLATLPAIAHLPDEQETGVDDLLVIPIALGGTDETGVWGRSDYADIDSLQGELNNRETQRAEILDKHADPWMHGPDVFLDESGGLRQDEKYLVVAEGESPPGYLFWDPQLVAVENEIAELKRDMMLTAGVSPESLGLGEQGGAESGRALKLRQHRTASAVRMRQKIYGPAIAKAFSLASKLANSKAIGPVWQPDGGAAPELEAEEIAVGFQDGLPNDMTEAVEREKIATEAGLSSRRAAIERLWPELSPEQIEEELAAIGEERSSGVRRIGLAAAVRPLKGSDDDGAEDQGGLAGRAGGGADHARRSGGP